MDFSLNSSVVLAAIVGLWLVWVVPFFLRRSGPVPAPAAASTPTAGEHPPQGSIMEKTANAAAGSASADRTGSSAVPGRRPALKIRRGRAAVALVGAAALPAALVTLVLAVVSVVSFWWPVAAVLVVAGAVATLRTLAVRDRRARVNAAFAAAMSSRPLHQAPPSTGDAALPGNATPEAGGKPAQARPTTVFDAEKPAGAVEASADAAEASAGTPEAPAARLTAADLKAAALAVAAAGAQEAGAPAATTQAPVPGTDPWEPVEVPLPTYVAAEKAQRSAPAPLELPAEPKPTIRTPIKNTAAKAAPKGTTAQAPAGTRLNLDDVLQRRRA
ncbi:hypothetical protein I6N91_06425 [Arthrobacter sp. MSA 4-2]|uniref:hypothetical protein n=1 Tax=Arthrobacter sp. MSA 4-2 TaxID=2794349 RepID=UPI0018E8DC3D|nr:hypothetical protein [Arthrobacter sp. MSA 4-2]MBJ2120614.1 hypothetical protein [Arthrobacter sp. MSA 4-2]